MTVAVRVPALKSGITQSRKVGTSHQKYSVESVALVAPWPKDLPVGNCKGYEDADIFSNPFEDEQLNTAVAVCATCPIKHECLDIGIERKDDGVYGGVLLFRGKASVLPKYRRK